MQQTEIPTDVDTPHTFLVIRADELVPFAAIFGVGIITDTLPLCVILGIAATIGFRRFRDSHCDGYLLYKLYWLGVLPIRGAINPFLRKIWP